MSRKEGQSGAFHFNGFDKPESNWFKMPNYWTDVTAEIKTIAELKVIEYVLRHTWGFQEYEIKKHITVDEFVNGRRRQDGTRIDRGTGLSERSVQYGLKDAVAHGFLEEEVDSTHRGRVKKYYSLSMKADGSPESEENTDSSLGVQTLHPRVQDLRGRGAKAAPRTEKDTEERNLEERNLSNSNYFELLTQKSKTDATFRNSKKCNEIIQRVSQRVTEPQLTRQSTGGMKPIGELLERHLPSDAAAHGSQQPSKSGQRGRPSKYPATPAIEALVSQWTDELHDRPEHARSNISQAARLWHESGVSEDTFRSLLYEARQRTKQAGNIDKMADGEEGELGFRNRMPYFFACLKKVIREDLQRPVNDRAPSNGKEKSSNTKRHRTPDVSLGTN